MTDPTPDVVRLQVEMVEVKTDLHEMKADVKALLALANQTKGGWKTIMIVAGVAGTMGALAAKIFPFIGGLPR